MDKANALARIYEVNSGADKLVNPRLDLTPTAGEFKILTNNMTGQEAIPVGAVVLRAETEYKTFSIATNNTPVFLMDVIKTGPDTVVAMELLRGGRIGVKKGTAVRLINEGEVETLDHGTWHKVVLKSGGVWAKFNHADKPLTIQTRGGVLGIKG